MVLNDRNNCVVNRDKIIDCFVRKRRYITGEGIELPDEEHDDKRAWDPSPQLHCGQPCRGGCRGGGRQSAAREGQLLFP